MRVVVSCSGKFHAFALVEQLQKNGVDVVFFTSYSSIVNSFFKILARRDDKEVIDPKSIRTNLILAFALKLFRKRPQVANDLFDKWVSRKVQKMNADVFIGWSGMSLETIKVAKRKGWKTILERGSTHISFQNDILMEEYFKRGMKFSIANETIQKERNEYETCDIISIPSNFVKSSFLQFGIRSDKLFVNPYGSNSFFSRTETKKDNTFRVLYLGKVSVQKGFYYLAEAINSLKDKNIEFWIIGGVDDELKVAFETIKNNSNVFYFGHINHYDLVNYIQKCDLGIQPSLQEGLSMVITQILKVGLPVIATPNSGAEELIINGWNGIIIPAKSSKDIVDVISDLFLDREKLNFLTENVENMKSDENSWKTYGERYLKILEN
jgi:glycosyltransferase involved in cell wall biosynthesis